MPRKNRSVANRKKSLRPTAPEPHLTLAGLRSMYEVAGGQPISCTITGHCRTQIFEFPRVHFQGASNEPHQSVYDSPWIHACVVADIRHYFRNETRSKHYAISPPLRHEVTESDEKLRSQTKGRTRVYLVVEEHNELSPVNMTNGECSILNRHSPDDIQIRGRRTSDPPPWELRTLRSPPMRRLWRADQVRNAIWQSIPPSRRTSPIVFSSPLISSAYAGTGLGRRSSIKLKIFWNKLLGTATSANWNVTYRP